MEPIYQLTLARLGLLVSCYSCVHFCPKYVSQFVFHFSKEKKVN